MWKERLFYFCFHLAFMLNFMKELSIFNIYILKVYPGTWFLSNIPITYRDNQACVAAQAFIVTLLFDPLMSALPIIVKQNLPGASSSFR